MNLKDKVILVTGGSRGIGAAVVKALHREGATVIIHYNSNRKAAEALAAELNAKRIHLLQANLEDLESVEKLWHATLDVAGRLDVIINCAGIMEPASIELPLKQWQTLWQRTLQVNTIALGWLSHQAANYFAKQGGGIIINLSSRAAYQGSPSANHPHYAASKGAVMSLTKTLARAYAKENVLAYVIAPGLVQTDMTEEVIQTKDLSEIKNAIPLGDIAQPEDIAETICFLASGRARHATGSTFHINSGTYL